MQWVHGHFQASPGERGEGLREMEKVRVKNTTPISSDHLPVLLRGTSTTLLCRPQPLWRLFSLGSDILRPKRSRLTAGNFEKLVLLKENMHLLDRK